MNVTALRTIAASAAFAVATGAATSANAGTIALYTFENGDAIGSAVSTIPNAANPGTHDAVAYRLGTYANGWGDAPCWTNNFPGNCVWSDASCTQMLARAPMAVHFSTNGVNANLGGCLDMANLANAMYANGFGSFTVEFFWRSASTCKDGTTMSMKYGRQLRLGPGDTYSSTVRMDGNYGASTSDKAIHYGSSTDSRYLSTYGWRHWAITFDASTTTAAFYFDYEPYGTVTDVNYDTSSSRNPALRFGARATNTDFYSGSNCMNGEISCIRVSNCVLGIDDFMRMGVAAYYPMKDAAAGQTAETVTNALVSGSADGTAGHAGSGKTPVFSSDRPGRYIFSSFAKDELLCEEPGSLEFKNGSSAPRGYVSLASLAGRLLMATRENSGATFECFFKKEKLAWGNIEVFSFKPGSLGWYARSNDDNVTSTQDYQNTVRAGTEGEALTDDGRWHHFAVVLGANASSTANAKNWKTATIYIDYAQPTNAAIANGVYWDQSSYWNTWSSLPFVVGMPHDLDTSRNGFIGKISSVRVTNKALTPDRFLVASDTMDSPTADKGFRWRFEEGAAGAAITAAADADGGEKWTTGEVTTYGTGWTAPAYSAARPSQTMQFGNAEIHNGRSASMFANPDGIRAVLENKTWYGAPALHPESWTMEFFAKADAAPSSAALLVGRGRLNSKTGAEWSDWSLAVQPNGKLALAGFRDDGAGGKAVYSYADIGTGILDGQWHRFEVIYDGATTTFQVWIDDGKALEETLASAQINSSSARYQFGSGSNLASFCGAIDEVRFVGRALVPAEFAKAKDEATVICIR